MRASAASRPAASGRRSSSTHDQRAVALDDRAVGGEIERHDRDVLLLRCRARRRARSSWRAGTRAGSRPCACACCRAARAPAAGASDPSGAAALRSEKMRSLARDFSSSRRAPPMAASKPCWSSACLSACVFITSVWTAEPCVNGSMPARKPSWLVCTMQIEAELARRAGRGTRSCRGTSRSCRRAAAGRAAARIERLERQVQQDRRNPCRSSRASPGSRLSATDLAQDVDALGLEPLQMGQPTGARSCAADLVAALAGSASVIRRLPAARPPGRSPARDVQAAFLLGVLLPPPAAGALGLAGRDGARAGRAADRGEAAVVQRVVRERRCRATKSATSSPRPVGERIELDEAARRVDLGQAASRRASADCSARRPVIQAARARRARGRAARPCARRSRPGARPRDWEKPLMPCRATSASTLGAAADRRADAEAVALLGLRPDVVGLGKQPAGVERDDLDVEDFPGAPSAMGHAWSSRPKLVVKTRRPGTRPMRAMRAEIQAGSRQPSASAPREFACGARGPRPNSLTVWARRRGGPAEAWKILIVRTGISQSRLPRRTLRGPAWIRWT